MFSQIATLLVDRFLPDMWQKYVFQNYNLSTEYRAYSKDIPTAYKGRQNAINSQRRISRNLMMMAILRCKRQVEESTRSILVLWSVHARTGYAITYLANASLPSLSTARSGVGWNFHNIF